MYQDATLTPLNSKLLVILIALSNTAMHNLKTLGTAMISVDKILTQH
jgi:hypothetical protein